MRILILMVVFHVTMACATDARPSMLEHPRWEEIRRTVSYIQQSECVKSDAVLTKEGLATAHIADVRAFCAMSDKEMLERIAQRFDRMENVSARTSEIVRPFYNCLFNGPNIDIPSYSNLGLSSSTCVWHDPNPGCKVEGREACLWGCNNNDPVLGWHTKLYESREAVENDILSKGYVQTDDYGTSLNYRRYIGQGYGYQVHSINADMNGRGSWHSEGPEPHPQFNWYAYFGGWWPLEVSFWHEAC